jgi:hypothetical protein
LTTPHPRVFDTEQELTRRYRFGLDKPAFLSTPRVTMASYCGSDFGAWRALIPR